MAVDLTGTPFVEGSTITYTTTLLDENNAAIPAASMTALTLTLLNPYSGLPVNGVNGINVLNVGRGTMNAQGLVTIRLLAADAMKETTLELELRRIRLNWTYSASAGVHDADIALTED